MGDGVGGIIVGVGVGVVVGVGDDDGLGEAAGAKLMVTPHQGDGQV